MHKDNLTPPSQTPPPTFTQYARALNVGMAVEGAKPMTIGQLEQAFRQYVAASCRREIARANR